MRLLKYHGLGNDFLILLDFDEREPVEGEQARALCDRHRGVGADGFIRVTGSPDAPGMELYNADGSRAETSGNGMRCLVRAVADAGLLPKPEVTVHTDRGPRETWVHDDGSVTVDLTPGAPAVVRPEGEALHVALDNPHVVVRVDDPARVDLEAVAVPFGPVNVEVVASGPRAGELTMRVWERGVGETQACGSGSCAAALAGRHWGVVAGKVAVHQPGGTLTVDIAAERILLSGPATYVATVDAPGRTDERGPAWR